MLKHIFLLLLIPFWGWSQHKEVSYDLINEVGTYRIESRTFSHEKDNSEGITYVIHKKDGDTLYHIDQFLNGWVALSNDGKTVAHSLTEKNGKPLDGATMTFYRDGKHFDTATLFRFLKYELDDAEKHNRLSKSGWLRNDSLLHTMASNPFYITDNKLFLSMEGPRLMVFDMNAMFHIYTGNGANHFSQNYYSVPNPPRREEFASDVYFPKGFPNTVNGRTIETVISSALSAKTAIPEEAKYRVEVSLKLTTDGTMELRKASVFSTKTNEEIVSESEKLKTALEASNFDTSLIPPKHPAWIFTGNFWLK
jgi:hypothetical protein